MGDMVLYVMRETVLVILDVISIAFFISALLSWFDPMRQWRISAFLFLLTEPLILPIRKLCEKKRWFQGSPIDVPFMLALLVIILLQTFLSLL